MGNRLFCPKSFYLIALMAGLTSCSYYGNDHYLAPEDNRSIHCGESTISFGAILLQQDKSAHAFAGIPIAPSASDSQPSWRGEMRVNFDNVGTDAYRVCKTSDLYLQSGAWIKTYPKEIWKSQVLIQNGRTHVGCTYKFGQLEDFGAASIRLVADAFRTCNTSTITLRNKSTSGYHSVPLQ